MENAWIVLDLMNASAKTDGLDKIVKNKLRCAQLQLVKTMQAV